MPAALKRPAAAAPESKRKKAHTSAAPCVCATWSADSRATLGTLHEGFAKTLGVDPAGKIAVATFGGDVSPVLSLGGLFPNMTYISAAVRESHAAPQLVSPNCGAAHVFACGASKCLRHGRRCPLRGPVDLLLSDGAVDFDELVAALKSCPRCSPL